MVHMQIAPMQLIDGLRTDIHLLHPEVKGTFGHSPPGEGNLDPGTGEVLITNTLMYGINLTIKIGK